MTQPAPATNLTPIGKILSILLVFALIIGGGYLVWSRMSQPQNRRSAGIESADPANTAKPNRPAHSIEKASRLPGRRNMKAPQFNSPTTLMGFANEPIDPDQLADAPNMYNSQS